MQTIPLIDLRSGSPVQLAELHKQKALNLINASRDSFGLASRLASHVAFPLGDYTSKRWLGRNQTPYAQEIIDIATQLGQPGVYTLNLCYEWGCTSGVFATEDSTRLLRVLDWPFPALGENMVVANQRGVAGDFYNITWPGIAGVYTAMAPGKFAAALNQAPMRRHLNGVVIDWIRNRIRINKQNALPPAHLLRQVFETATSYDDARRMLCETPVALPVHPYAGKIDFCISCLYLPSETVIPSLLARPYRLIPQSCESPEPRRTVPRNYPSR